MTSKTESDGAKGERIAKRLARAGLCSRRDAERWIAAGRVAVDGKVLESPAFNVTPEHKILVDGNPLPDSEPTALWRYHKPSGLVTTNRDPQGRDTIFDKLPDGLPRVITVGRLDLTTEGLLLLTNDGDLARFLELPSTGWTRRYRVRVNGRPDENALARLANGLTIDGVRYDSIQAKLDRQQGANAWLTMALKEGKNREIRNVCEHLGLTVNRLIRVSYGPFQLGNLDRSAVEKVPNRILREQLAHWPGLGAVTATDDTPPAASTKQSTGKGAGKSGGRPGGRTGRSSAETVATDSKADTGRGRSKPPSRRRGDKQGRGKLRLKPGAASGKSGSSSGKGSGGDSGKDSGSKSGKKNADRRRKP